jgi:hypothetical protein
LPVPVLSRWPTGPAARTKVPDGMIAPASASGPTMTRTDPLPSSTRMPRPSAKLVGEPIVVPVTVTRKPSSASPTIPVATSPASGRGPGPRSTTAVASTRRVRAP